MALEHSLNRRASVFSIIAVCGLLTAATAFAQVRPLNLNLATPNRAIFSADPSQFYMYTNRSFEGRQSKPWQAGKYGYVRNPQRTKEGIIYSKFHEGVDIRPTARDKSGNPLDTIRAIADGKVVYVNNGSRASSYGRYVVIEHDWGYGKFYSLYAHLANATCKMGDIVRSGGSIAKMGYTGTGIDRTRAHLHLELCMIISPGFGKWHDKSFTTANAHGLYNGLNLAGIDIAGLYHAHRKNPSITLPQFISGMNVYFKVVVPNKRLPDVVRFYPWIARDMAKSKGAPSWELSLSSSGVPLAVAPSTRKVSAPIVSWVKYSALPHAWSTRSRLTGSGATAKLTSSGQRYVRLLMGDF